MMMMTMLIHNYSKRLLYAKKNTKDIQMLLLVIIINKGEKTTCLQCQYDDIAINYCQHALTIIVHQP